MSRWLPYVVFVLLACVLLVSTQRVNAAPAFQTTDTPTATLTPTATPTPAYVTVYTLDSGNTLVVERRYTFGELAVFLAVVANSALYGLHWAYEVTRREAR